MKLQNNLHTKGVVPQRGQPSVLETALRYADYRWYVLPIWSVDRTGDCLCGNKNCNSPGKHPHGGLVPNGLKDATIDKEVIASWFTGGHNLNIGICTGQRSGIAILDIDIRHGGSIESVETKFGKLPKTPYTKTGGGGYHFLFKYREGLRNSAGLLGAGLDVRGKGGYVVAPPSLHTSGKVYSWKLSPSVRLADCPDWMLNVKRDTVRITHNVGSSSKTEYSIHDTIPVGARNDTLMSKAGGLRRIGYNLEQILQELFELNARACNPPLEEAEIICIAKSAATYEPVYDLLYHKDGDDLICRRKRNG